MISRGFFSAFVGAFAIVLLISLLYSQSIQYDAQSNAETLAIVNEQVSKDWFLARNALENFASDAILNDIQTRFSPTPPGCNAGAINGADFSVAVETYFDDTISFMNTNYGLNCDANLDVGVRNTFENPDIPSVRVLSNERAYGLLSCTRSTGDISLTIKHPFVIRKEVVVTGGGALPCTVSIHDRLGDSPTSSYDVVDVTQSFP